MPEAVPGLVEMFDNDGNAVAVPENEVRARFSSGELGFLPDQLVPVRDNTGEIKQLPGAEAAKKLGTYQNDVVSPEAFKEQEDERKYTSGTGKAVAAGAGLARGLSFGLSDVALSEFGGDDTRTWLEQTRRRNNLLSLATEGVGMAAPLLVSGGSSLLARGVTSGVRGAAAIGAGVEGLAGRALVRAGAREGGFLARGLSTAAGQAAEMSLYGAGSEVSRATLANESLSGEKVAAAMGMHALLGGAVGGAVGAGAVGLQRAAHGGLTAATSLAERVTGRSSSMAAETLGEKGARLLDVALPGGLQGAAARSTVEATGAGTKALERFGKLAPEVQERAAKILSIEVPEFAGGKVWRSAAENAQALEHVVARNEERVAALAGKLEDVGARPEATKILEGLAPRGSEGKALLGQVERASEDLGKLQDLAGSLRAPAPPSASRELLELRGTLLQRIEGEVGRIEQTAAEQLGPGWGVQWAGARAELEAAQAAKALVTDGSKAFEGKSAGEVLRKELPQLVGSLVSGNVLGAVGTAATAWLGPLAKRYGPEAEALFLRRLSQTGNVGEAASHLVDLVVSQSVKGFFRRAGEAGGRAGRRGLRAGEEAGADAAETSQRPQTRKERERARQERVSQDPEAEFKEARERVAALAAAPGPARLPPGTSPGVASSTQATAGRAVTFLASKIPAAPVQSSLQPHLARYEVSPSEQRKFMAYVRAVDDPTSVLRDLERGRMGPEGLEALRTVYPELYAQVQQQAREELALLDQPLSYQQARELGELLGVVGHPAMEPGFIAAIQQTFTPAPPAAPVTPFPARPVNVARLYQDTQEAA